MERNKRKKREENRREGKKGGKKTGNTFADQMEAFGESSEEEKENPFKYLLIDKVQHSFDEKLEPFPEKFETPEDK